jgi:hypothetical protein
MSAIIANNALIIAINQINQLPEEGAKSIPLMSQLNFTSTVSSYVLDLTLFIELGNISFIQTIYIDNSLNANPFSVTMNSSGQVITAAPYSQGYYPVLAPNPAKFTFSTLPGSGIIPVQLINTPIPGPVWSVQ